ncbi:Eco57I restriction-modification methylase domain-containing protein [Marinobacter persicus]|uniref:site-specific DNA-methyltransferase (adenine-specific) n=1 Tax=Marinobacter persicus TaxID=930118 RepID=A0A2S6G2B7_9GAMM|nr:N-6 DNA methylase [Marinobacter persicus]PPK49831.1 Alw26I/Eco31I/Esp3I family type II restriction m6 adenine DNA methyltransferase [Marinobacter persicus]PPK51113.1 Alw26I/Eco31I/Esp3I family type II restriction m6 adenine DNA methyltransferase [Marinobacter persicus]PPK55596.1 Alw26I/Eco31I/Esp3I family type II restriction m6 adenine DNA methyltransferase [Marinobacter persicus]
MAAPKPLETELLISAEKALDQAVANESTLVDFELRLQILEAVSSRFGGFKLSEFHRIFEVQSLKPAELLLELAAPVAAAIENSEIDHALALSVLARETLEDHDRKSTGAYHTDFRLASRLAAMAASNLNFRSKIIDPACGAGILLAAITREVCGMDRSKTTHWIRNGVHAADLSGNSLRAALLSIASFTDDLEALRVMKSKWHLGDSLLANSEIWETMAPGGFDGVIGNPPWEKLKLSKHEFLKARGNNRHYGESVEGFNEELFSKHRNEVSTYAREIVDRYPKLRNGEPDLYIAFTELFFNLCRDQGTIAALLPGGLIRSQGTTAIRKELVEASRDISLSIIDNRSRFFAIDSRFKFLAVALVKCNRSEIKRNPIQLLHESGTRNGLQVNGRATIGRKSLSDIRPDLSFPEVRNAQEWQLYSKIMKAGQMWFEPKSSWKPKFCRELDMTRERKKFVTVPAKDALPVIEGRMVQAHRFGVKGYLSGAGRRALWEAYPVGNSKLRPQFWIRSSDIPQRSYARTQVNRVGFCDIAGQTNERSLMACIIPAGVACGNKVPTITFPNDPSEDRLLVWASVANSFVFDWMLRRVLTTTVNYFLLQSVPLPKLTKNGLPWKKLVSAAKELQKLNNVGATEQTFKRMATLRCEIDTEVALAYNLNLEDMELIFRDFPILDRGQVSLPHEERSTITRDTVLAAMARRRENSDAHWTNRVEEAELLGSKAYIPSEIASCCTVNKETGVSVNE